MMPLLALLKSVGQPPNQCGPQPGRVLQSTLTVRRHLIQGRLCTEIIEPVGPDSNQVTDCLQINLGMELQADEIVCNVKSLDRGQFTLHQHPSRCEAFWGVDKRDH
jgi:hypothetical protein